MFDPKCFALAEHFMPHASVVPKAELAQMVQDVVEGFVSDYEARLEAEREQIERRDAERKTDGGKIC